MKIKKNFVGMERIQEAIHATERNLSDVEKRFLDLLEEGCKQIDLKHEIMEKCFLPPIGKECVNKDCPVLSDSALSNIGEIAEQIAAMRVMVSKFWRDMYLEYYSKQYPINDRRNN